MQYQYLTLLAAATLLSSAAASPAPTPAPTPATGAQITQYAEDVVDYITATVENSPAFSSVLSFVEDNASAASALQSWDDNAANLIQSGVTSVADVVGGMPTEIQAFYSSVYEAELSIAYKDGVLTKGADSTDTATASSAKSTNAAPTGGKNVFVVGGAAVAGLMGVLAL